MTLSHFDPMWNSQTIDKLRQLAAQPLSAAHIASRLGCTRNAVIGKCARSGISLTGKSGRTAKPKTFDPPKPKTSKLNCIGKVAVNRILSRKEHTMHQQQQLDDILSRKDDVQGVPWPPDKGCLYVLGEPKDLVGCGLKRFNGVYCRDHYQRVYQSSLQK